MDRPQRGGRALRWTAWLMVLLGLTGCGGRAPRGPAAAASPTAATPTPPPLVRVLRPPELEAWDAALAACAAAGPVLLAIEPAAPGTPAPADWRLFWGPPPEDWPVAYALGRDTWALLVHADNPVRRVEAATWRALWVDPGFAWAAPGRGDAPERLLARPVVPRPESRLGRALTAQVGEAWQRHPRALLAPTPAQVVRRVAEQRAAFGLVPAGWLSWARQAREDLPWARVRALTPPAIPAWEAEVVLAGRQAPGPEAQRWILCTQKNLK